MTRRPRGVPRATAVAFAACLTLAALIMSMSLAAAARARATDVSAAQLQALAGRAAGGDQAALAELRAVDAVDGQPAQLAVALDARSAVQLRSRLRALAGSGSAAGASGGAGGASGVTAGASGGPSASDAQRAAADILSARRFGSEPVPDPVASVFDKVGRWLGKLAGDAPGGPAVFWGVIAAIVLVLTGLGVRRTMRRLDPVRRAGTAEEGPASDTPESLECDARAAEARGDYGDAVRLRFRAGLLMLNATGTIDYRPSLLTTDVSRRLRSPRFDSLAETFERIAYGGDPGGAEDAAAARDGWRELLTGARRG